MRKSKYLPVNSSERVTWITNFNQKLPTYSANLGISQAQLDSVAADTAAYSYTVNLAENVKDFGKQLTEFLKVLSRAPIGTPIGAVPTFVQPTAPDEVPSGIFTRIGKLVAIIKSSVNYTEAMGMDLGVVGSGKTASKTELKPLLKVTLNVGKPEISHIIGDSDSVHIYADHADGKGMVFLTNSTLKKYVDTTALPAGQNAAIWQYCAIYVVDDEEVGVFSDIVSITVGKTL